MGPASQRAWEVCIRETELAWVEMRAQASGSSPQHGLASLPRGSGSTIHHHTPGMGSCQWAENLQKGETHCIFCLPGGLPSIYLDQQIRLPNWFRLLLKGSLSHPTPKAWGAWSHPRNLEPKYTLLCLSPSLSLSVSPSRCFCLSPSLQHSQAWGHRWAGAGVSIIQAKDEPCHGQVSACLLHEHLLPPHRPWGHKLGDKANSCQPEPQECRMARCHSKTRWRTASRTPLAISWMCVVSQRGAQDPVGGQTVSFRASCNTCCPPCSPHSPGTLRPQGAVGDVLGALGQWEAHTLKLCRRMSSFSG